MWTLCVEMLPTFKSWSTASRQVSTVLLTQDQSIRHLRAAEVAALTKELHDQMRDIFGVVDLPTEVEPDELISPDTPEGYETVAGWWATREAAALEMLSDPIATIYADEQEMITRADQRGILWKWCTAPTAHQRMGFKISRAFPLEMLQQFYPLNP
jgi:hypothetical protein